MNHTLSNQRIHEGPLVLDQHHRYYISEPDRSLSQMITLTSGLVVELLLEDSNKWIVGRVGGDGKDYWFFMRSGGKCKLACGMTARYIEPRYSLLDSAQSTSLLAEEEHAER